MAHRIIPAIWFNRNAREAVDHYLSVFDDSEELSASNYPTEGLMDFQQPLAGDTLEIQFRIGDLTFSAINAGSEFRPNPSISFLVHFDPSQDADAEARLDRIWKHLLIGGLIRMELSSYPFSPHYGWVEDRYGVNWQLMTSQPGDEPRPFVTPMLMYPHGRTQASEAIELYTWLFEDSQRGDTFPYSDLPDAGSAGPQPQGALAYADFTLSGQWFAAMDSGAPQDFTFNEGISLMTLCSDQAEIDRLWDVLSTQPDAEQCGWCKDRFGVSWQVVPEKMPDISEPEAFQKMCRMKKLVIADFD